MAKSAKKIRKMTYDQLIEELHTQEYIVESIGYQDESKEAEKERSDSTYSKSSGYAKSSILY